MIEKNIYENYSIDFAEDYEIHYQTYCFIFNNNRELYLTEEKKIPIKKNCSEWEFCENRQFCKYGKK